MNLNKFDMVVLVVMPLAIIGMSFTMPALGLGSSDIGGNDIPEFNITTDRFDFARDFPDDPTTSTTGSLTLDTEDPSSGERAVFLNETTEVGLADYQPYGEPPVQVRLTDLAGSEVDPVTLSEEGDSSMLEVGPWEVEVTLDRIHSEGTSESVFVVDYEVLNGPEGDEPSGVLEIVFSMIPGAGIIGQLIAETGPIQGLVAAAMYLISIYLWFVQTFNQVIFNLVLAIADLSLFFIQLVSWLFGTYLGLVTGAPGWAVVFTSIPGILLSLVLAKVSLVLVSLLPTT